jgi:hypothetical protein
MIVISTALSSIFLIAIHELGPPEYGESVLVYFVLCGPMLYIAASLAFAFFIVIAEGLSPTASALRSGAMANGNRAKLSVALGICLLVPPVVVQTLRACQCISVPYFARQ